MIRHPYSFVPFGGAPGREVSAGHESYKGLSGTLSCRLRAERLLTIRSYFDRPGKHPYVPASSLRGLVRTTVQMLGAGCARHISGRGELERKLGPLAPCVSENACLACRMFGFSADRSDYAWASKVRFYDSHAVQIDKWEEMRLDPVDGAQWQSHGARHTRFYFTDYQSQYPRQPAGWKVYRHAKRVMPAQTSSFRALHCVPEGTEFSFRIDYSSLTEEEFSVLCFALTLSHGCGAPYQVSLAHKLGYGKSAGLGSCTITIEDVIPLALDRYFGGSSPEKPKPSCTVIHSIMDQTPFGAFRDNLAWPPPESPAYLLFPPKSWFAKQLGIDDFEKNPPKETEDRLRRLAASGTPPPPAPPPPDNPELPARIRVTLKKIKNGWKGISVEGFGDPPQNYTCMLSGLAGWLKEGDVVEVKRERVDHATRTFTGRVAR